MIRWQSSGEISPCLLARLSASAYLSSAVTGPISHPAVPIAIKVSCPPPSSWAAREESLKKHQDFVTSLCGRLAFSHGSQGFGGTERIIKVLGGHFWRRKRPWALGRRTVTQPYILCHGCWPSSMDNAPCNRRAALLHLSAYEYRDICFFACLQQRFTQRRGRSRLSCQE